MICRNSNGGVGYLPTADEYEVRDSTNPQGLVPKVYGLCALASGAELLVRRARSQALVALFAAASTGEEGFMRFTSIEPTPFFAYHDGRLRHLVHIGLADVDSEGTLHEAHIHLRAPDIDEILFPGIPSSETSAYDFWFPDFRQPAEIWLGLHATQELHDERLLSCTAHTIQTALPPYAIRTLRIHAAPP